MFTNLKSDGLIGPFEVNDSDLIERLRRELDSTNKSYRNLHTRSINCQKVLNSVNVKSQIEKAFGSNLNLWRSNCFKKVDGSGEVSWHHDRHFENADENIQFENLADHFSILIAVTDMNEQTGIMEFLLGSHLPTDGYSRDVRPYHLRSASEHFLQLPEWLITQRVQVELKAGQFMLFHSGLLHRSLPAEGNTQARFSMVARFCNRLTQIPEALAEEKEVFAYPFHHSQDMRLIDKVAIVTGGSKGIGKAIVERLVMSGCKVAALARNKQSLLDMEHELLAYQISKEHIVSYVADVTSFTELRQVFEKVSQELGPIDIVFANAGNNCGAGAVESLSLEEWFEPLEANLKGLFNTCKIAVEYMANRGGNLITLGSGIGHIGSPNCTSYAAAKSVNWNFTMSLAKEVVNKRINVNELIPGPVKTDMNPNASGVQWKLPADIAELAILLATQDLDNGATGQSFSLKRL
ncbi:MAG: SDR family NAD(P)-dependent oxidoreductase [Paraglaciecola sp.]|uniref:SDR family NAD(P)-dependent oxidoreductase n=1 Tax=Paraglaciecola sp. TaxID=1920173 RepID=UPI0032991953